MAIEPTVAARITLVGFDVDGVLTDAGVYLGVTGSTAVELKRFNIQDGTGIRLLRETGTKVVWVSGRVSDATTARARELKIDACHQDDGAYKVGAFDAILARFGIDWSEAAFVGDDIPDLAVMKRVGLPVAVANAVPEVRAVAHYVTRRPGGEGAAREFVEEFLRARGEWDDAVDRYVDARSREQGVAHGA